MLPRLSFGATCPRNQPLTEKHTCARTIDVTQSSRSPKRVNPPRVNPNGFTLFGFLSFKGITKYISKIWVRPINSHWMVLLKMFSLRVRKVPFWNIPKKYLCISWIYLDIFGYIFRGSESSKNVSKYIQIFGYIWIYCWYNLNIFLYIPNWNFPEF